MYLVQLLLPLYDNNKQPFSHLDFDAVRSELAEHYGGVTAFLQSPAEGIWKANEEEVSHDDVVMFEVMTQKLDPAWWAEYRKSLQKRFRQEEVMVRAISVQKL